MSQAAALAARFGLPAGATDSIRAVLDLLERDPAAPTTLTGPADALDRHFADSLVALEVEAVRRARAIADLGSGAGFPGLALAIALPEARVWLVESSGRKCEFLARAVAAAGADNAVVVRSRAEEWENARAVCEVVTTRALAPLPVVVEYAAPVLAVGGLLVAWKGARVGEEEAAGEAAAGEVGLEPDEVRAVQPFPGARDRHLHLYRKVRPTPDRFPRGAGMATKRPLA